MSVLFRIPTDPYDMGVRLYAKGTVELKPGVTPLVGCNGVGKTTFLRVLKDRLSNRKGALTVRYDNLKDGWRTGVSAAIFYGDINLAANLALGSEGENIRTNFTTFVRGLRSKLYSGEYKECWILLDAIGSGLSIDNIIEIKDFFQFLANTEKGFDFYFVVATNEYEFASGQECLDVGTMNYVRFKDYNDYRRFILGTRKKRNAKDERAKARQEKKEAKNEEEKTDE